LALLEAGLAFKGRVRLNPFNHRAAYVTPEHNVLGMDILIDGHRHR
jgi:UDP-2,3-diacylglucosamine pyrophosphatase LpxH